MVKCRRDHRGVDYHSTSNHFTVKGSLKLADNLRENRQWKDAQVTREFELTLLDKLGKTYQQCSRNGWGEGNRDGRGGKTTISVLFDEPTSITKPLEIWHLELSPTKYH